MTTLSPLIEMLEQADKALQAYEISKATNEHLGELYKDVATIRELSNLLWRSPFMEMCKRGLFETKQGGGEAA